MTTQITAAQVRKIAPQLIHHFYRELNNNTTSSILLVTGAKLHARRNYGRSRVTYSISGYNGRDEADMLDALQCKDFLARLRALGHTTTSWLTQWRDLTLDELASCIDGLTDYPSTQDMWWNDRAEFLQRVLAGRRYPENSPRDVRLRKLNARLQAVLVRNRGGAPCS